MEHSAFEDGIFSDFAGPLSPLDGKPLTPTSSAMTSVSHGMHSVMLSLPPGATVMHQNNTADLCSQRLPDCQTLLSAGGSPKMDPYKSSTPDYETKMEYVTKMGCYSPTQKYEYLTGQKLENHQQYSPPPPSATNHQNPVNGLQQHQHHKQMAAHQHHLHHQHLHQNHHSPSAMLNEYHHHHALHTNGKLEYDPHHNHQQHQQHIAHIYGSPHHNHHSHELINTNNNEHNMSLSTNGLIGNSLSSTNGNTDGGLLQPSLGGGGGGGGGPSASTPNSNTNSLSSSSSNNLNSPPTGLSNGIKLNNKGKHDDMCSPPNADGTTNGANNGGSNSSVTSNNNTPPAVKKNDKKKGDPNGIKKKKTR